VTTSATWVVPLPTMPLLGGAEGVPWLTDSVCGPRVPNTARTVALPLSNTRSLKALMRPPVDNIPAREIVGAIDGGQ